MGVLSYLCSPDKDEVPMNEETAFSASILAQKSAKGEPRALLMAYKKSTHPKVRFKLARDLLHTAMNLPPEESLALLAHMATNVQITPLEKSKRLSKPYKRTLSTKAALLAKQKADKAALFLDETLNGRLHFTTDGIKRSWALSVLNACAHVSPESPTQSCLPALLTKWGHVLLDLSDKHSARVQRLTP